MFVERRSDLSIYGAWSVRQRPGQEELADDNPELVAFLNPLPDPRTTAIDSSIASTTIGAVQPATVAQLKAMTVAEYSAWFDANFVTAATLIALIKRLMLIIIRRVL